MPCPDCQSAAGKPELEVDWESFASVDDELNSPDTALERMDSMSDITPFAGRRQTATAPVRVLHRFTKPGGHWAEIRERTVTQFKAIEFIVFVDGSLLESQMFRGKRADA